MRTGTYIYKRKDNRWEARVKIESTNSGKRYYKYIYGSSYQEVLEKKEAFEKTSEARRPRIPKEGSVSFGDAAYFWLQSLQPKWKPSTHIKYQTYLENHILPLWRTVPLTNINQIKYEQLMLNLQEKLQPSSLSSINSIIVGVLKFSVKKKLIPYIPEILCQSYCKKSKSAIEILTKNESDCLLNYVIEHPSSVGIGIVISLYQGLRIGELCALKWDDVDFKEKTLCIHRTLQRIRNPASSLNETRTSLYLGTPKSGKKRVIPLHPEVLSFLKRQEFIKGAYILSGYKDPLEPRALTNQFKKILQCCGIRDVNFHILRHTFASNCVEAGMDIKALSEILGHSSIRITMDRYVHLSMNYKKSQITVLKMSELTDGDK